MDTSLHIMQSGSRTGRGRSGRGLGEVWKRSGRVLEWVWEMSGMGLEEVLELSGNGSGRSLGVVWDGFGFGRRLGSLDSTVPGEIAR